SLTTYPPPLPPPSSVLASVSGVPSPLRCQHQQVAYVPLSINTASRSVAYRHHTSPNITHIYTYWYPFWLV
ncbi:hypothetical protein LSH36_270g02035, partial [Paralvinella palmiformis]